MLHVILASHNRRVLTERIVRQVESILSVADIGYDLTLFDDASTDNTAVAIATLNPQAKIIQGSGNAFWSGGMAAAESQAREACRCTDQCWMVWLNDDVELFPDAFLESIEEIGRRPDTIYCGAFLWASKDVMSYSGYLKEGGHPLSFTYVQPSDYAKEVDSFSGNLVFVPRDAARKIGGINSDFPHALGDLDYGLRARKLQVPIMLLPNFQGRCEPNPTTAGGFFASLAAYFGRKGPGNLRGQSIVLRQHFSPIFFPLPIISSFLLWFVRELSKRFGRQRGQSSF